MLLNKTFKSKELEEDQKEVKLIKNLLNLKKNKNVLINFTYYLIIFMLLL